MRGASVQAAFEYPLPVSGAIAAYILACAAITIISAALMTDYTSKDIEGEFE